MDKNDVRQTFKQLRANVTEREQKEMAVQNQLFTLFPSPSSVFCYQSFGSELSTGRILSYYQKACAVYTPEVMGKDMLLIDCNGNVVNEVAELTIVPLLAFDKQLFRTGYGGGYYDRFLAKNKTLAVGIAFDEQLCEGMPRDAFDFPLDMIITPTRIWKK